MREDIDAKYNLEYMQWKKCFKVTETELRKILTFIDMRIIDLLKMNIEQRIKNRKLG